MPRSSKRPEQVTSLFSSFYEQMADAAWDAERPRRIATHRKPDVDALVGVSLAQKYLFPGEATEVSFPSPSALQRRWDDFDCVVDIGRTYDPLRLRFDHKPPAFPDRNLTCAAKLVWEFLLQKGWPLGHLVELIDAVHDGDSAARRASSRLYQESLKSGIHAFYEHLKAGNVCDREMVQCVSAWLDRCDAGLRALSTDPPGWEELTSGLRKGPGTYALVLQAPARRKVMIGRTGTLGRMELLPGYYVYLGSALKNLRGRLKHHLTPVDRLNAKWQVDFLRPVTTLEEIWYTESSFPWECPWAECMSALPDAQIPSPRKFGASKCEGKCETHLPYFAEKPSLEAFRAKVRKLRAGGCRVERLVVGGA